MSSGWEFIGYVALTMRPAEVGRPGEHARNQAAVALRAWRTRS